MAERRENVSGQAKVKATMLHAHLIWGGEQVRGLNVRLRPMLAPEVYGLVSPGVLATSWISLAALLAVDRAIAEIVGGRPADACRAMGHHSAVTNLAGVYRSYLVDEPHRLFENLTLLHARFLDFGRSTYERLEDRAGRMRQHDYPEWSPLFCASALGYYAGALEMLHVPGPISVVESSCMCAGAGACTYDLRW